MNHTIECYNRKQQRIIGVLEQPQEKQNIQGTCIIQHGWGGTKEQSFLQATKDAFLKKNFQTILFDTTNSFGESDGTLENALPQLHYEDLEDIIIWARKQTWFEAPLALVGHSLGGYCVLRYGQDHPAQVDYLVALAPVIDGVQTFNAHRTYHTEVFKAWHKNGFYRATSPTNEGKAGTYAWDTMEAVRTINLVEQAHTMTTPTLLLIGDRDRVCSATQSQKLFDAMPDGVKEIALIPEANHTFTNQTSCESMQSKLTNWLTERLSARP